MAGPGSNDGLLSQQGVVSQTSLDPVWVHDETSLSWETDARLRSLEDTVSSSDIQDQIDALNSQLTALNARVTALENAAP